MKRAIAVLLAATIMLFAVGCAESADKPASSSTESSTVSTVSPVEGDRLDVAVTELNGTVRVLRGDGTAEILTAGSKLGAGDSVITDHDSTVDLQIGDYSTLITVSSSSEILFDTAAHAEDGRELVIVVRKGSISNSVDVKLETGDIYEVCTGDMTMAIRGTDVLVDCRDGGTSVSLLTGKALVYNYYDDQVYEVPAGVRGFFMPDEEPDFKLIHLGGYAGISEAAEALINNAEEDDKYFTSADEYEKTLRDSYLVDDDMYSFRVVAPVEDNLDENDTTTTVTTDTSVVESTSETTSITTTRTTAGKTTTSASAVTTTSTVPSAPTEPTAPSASTEPTTPSAPTEPTTPSAPTEPTTPSDPTEPTTPSDPTEPTTPSDPAEPTTSSAPTEPTTPSEPTEPTESTSQALRYFYTISGLYYDNNGESISLGNGAHGYGDLALPTVISASGTADNGQTFSFEVSVSQSNVGSYAEPQRVYAVSATDGEYSAGIVFAMLTIITY